MDKLRILDSCAVDGVALKIALLVAFTSILVPFVFEIKSDMKVSLQNKVSFAKGICESNKVDVGMGVSMVWK